MNIKSIVLLLLVLGLGGLSAQTFNHKLVPFNSPAVPSAGGEDTVKILAVMVEFQPDKDGATFGNGTFGSIYTQNYGNDIIDPLPHDQSYFEKHLLFVKNYFSQVSGGKVQVVYTVLPKIITVDQRMRNYSPTGNSGDFTPLGDFAKEVWRKADSANPGFNFKDYNLFTIFHAGVGKDISLPGSVGEPKDLPSVFMSNKTLDQIYGSGFKGYPVSGNSFFINNSLILPETESREVDSYGGIVLYQLTINGLLAASVGSYLGLPDLFDTQSGQSAIGRFGLEDGQSIFAFNGAFPPEPSAWEKIFLGWTTPVSISPGNYNINLVTQLAASAADTVILKVPINSAEYFLIQNRQRDANHDGAKVTYFLNGNFHTETFHQDQVGFYSSDIDSLKGVITDVDEFDWALPGQIDDTSDYKGGILIWHIDQNVIDSTIANDRINADKTRRGVNLMEASGVQEIGELFTTVLGDQVIGEGSYEDYWYKSNPAQLYKNLFAAGTRPSSNANSGANSLISISDFSGAGNRMSFKITYGDSLIKPVFTKQISLSSQNNSLNVVPAGTGNEFALVSNNELNIINGSGDLIKTFPGFSVYKTASVRIGNNTFIAGAFDSTVNVAVSGNDSSWTLFAVNAGDVISAAPVIYEPAGGTPLMLIGTAKGYVKAYGLNLNAAPQPDNTFPFGSTGVNIEIKKISCSNDYYAFVGENNSQFKVYDNSTSVYTGNGSVLDFATTKDNNGNYINIVLTSGNAFRIISKGQLVREFTVNTSDSVKSFSLADLKENGNNYILFTAGNNIEAVNLQGADAENFPYSDPRLSGFEGTPLAADFTGDPNSEVIATTTDGRIFAVDGGSGNLVNGFPLTTGVKLSSEPALLLVNSKISLAVLNIKNNFSEWNIGAGTGKIYWSEENGSMSSSSYTGSASQQNVSNLFFPSNRTYNYPNPVYGNKTYIHYYVAQDSKINIKIFDIAGDFVAELNDVAQGGLEKETAWNVSNIQSGVYLARVEAQSNNGKTETNIIKIAVVK